MFRATRVLRANPVAQATNAVNAVKREIKNTGSGGDTVLKKGARRDPELYVRGRKPREKSMN